MQVCNRGPRHAGNKGNKKGNPKSTNMHRETKRKVIKIRNGYKPGEADRRSREMKLILAGC